MTDEITDDVIDEQPDQYEEEAVKYGWKPPEEFTGEGNHMSAEAFMTRGPGTSRKALEQVEALKAEREKDRAEYRSNFERMEAAQKARMAAEIESRAKEIAAEKRKAAEEGDMDRYDELDKIKVENPPEVPTAEKAAIETWISNNAWFNEDPLANEAAGKYYSAFTAKGDTPAVALEKVTKKIQARYPDLFPQPDPPPRKAAAVDGGGLPRRASSSKKGWADIPAEDRRLVKAQIERGEWNALAKEQKTTPNEAFAAAYWEQDNG